MPFCTNCGNSTDSNAFYCAKCGAAQPRPGSGPNTPPSDFLHGMGDRTASILCYIPVFGVIPSIIFLASQKFRHNQRVRFNAFQSVYLFVAWLIASSALPILFLGSHGWGVEHSFVSLIKLGVVVCWIYLLIKASHNEQVSLPVIGDLAARSTSEQL